MRISRRPNKRASIENAPGPKHMIAMALEVTSAVASLVSNRPGEETALLTLTTTATMPANGVI